MQYTEDIITRLSCEIAESVYDKYTAEIYGLRRCPSDFSEDDLTDKRLLRYLLKNPSNCCNCNIDLIKSLT